MFSSVKKDPICLYLGYQKVNDREIECILKEQVPSVSMRPPPCRDADELLHCRVTVANLDIGVQNITYSNTAAKCSHTFVTKAGGQYLARYYMRTSGTLWSVDCIVLKEA